MEKLSGQTLREPGGFVITSDYVELDLLAQERLRYAQRLIVIAGQPGCEAEFKGCLVQIQRVNDAVIQFARGASDCAVQITRC